MELEVAGARIFAATGGKPFDPKQPLLVFVHGAGMDHTVWALQTRYFAHHGRAVLALDLPGHGRSEGSPLPSIEALADWLGALIAAAGVDRAALVGHSMGALAALEAAARHPGKVSSLALLGAAVAMPVHPDLIAAAEADDVLAFELITAWGYGKPAHLGRHPAPGLWMLGGGRKLLARARPGTLAIDLKACNAYQGASAAAARVQCPTLLLSGTEDRMTPIKDAKSLASAIAGARQAALEGAGHMMMIEQPDATLDALRAFL
jgi:pimeloyl-ACP methyl ester carboxylesterase